MSVFSLLDACDVGAGASPIVFRLGRFGPEEGEERGEEEDGDEGAERDHVTDPHETSDGLENFFAVPATFVVGLIDLKGVYRAQST